MQLPRGTVKPRLCRPCNGLRNEAERGDMPRDTLYPDFYPDIQTHDELRAAVQESQVSLGPMTAPELTGAIEGPAKAVGGNVDPELTKTPPT